MHSALQSKRSASSSERAARASLQVQTGAFTRAFDVVLWTAEGSPQRQGLWGSIRLTNMSNARVRVEGLRLRLLYDADVVTSPIVDKPDECPIWGSAARLPRFLNPDEALIFDWPPSYRPNGGENLGGVFEVTYSWTDDGPSESVNALVSKCHHEARRRE